MSTTASDFPSSPFVSSFPAYQVTLAQTSKQNSLDPLRFHCSRGAPPTPPTLPVSIHLLSPPSTHHFPLSSSSPLELAPCSLLTLCLRAKLLACRSLKGPIEICDVFHPGGHPKRWLWSRRLMRILNCSRSATVDFYLCMEPNESQWSKGRHSRNRAAASSHSLHLISFYICKEHRNQSIYPGSSTVNYYGERGQF